MKNFKLLSIMVITVFFMAGCKNSDNANSNTDISNSTAIHNESQSDITKAESSNIDTTSTKSITYDKAEIEKKVKESENITEDCINYMKWSPNGKELIYYTDDGQMNYNIYMWKVGEERPIKANIDIGSGTSFGWSPNSEYVLVYGGTSVIRGIKLINANGDGEIFTYQTAGIAYNHLNLEQFWSSDSTKIAVANYNSEIIALPNAELCNAFNIEVYDVKSKTKKTIIKSTATEYYTIEKWVDNDTIRCDIYAPKNNEIGNVVEQKDIKIC